MTDAVTSGQGGGLQRALSTSEDEDLTETLTTSDAHCWRGTKKRMPPAVRTQGSLRTPAGDARLFTAADYGHRLSYCDAVGLRLTDKRVLHPEASRLELSAPSKDARGQVTAGRPQQRETLKRLGVA